MMVGDPKTRSNARLFGSICAIAALLFSSFACSNIYFDPADLSKPPSIGGYNPEPEFNHISGPSSMVTQPAATSGPVAQQATPTTPGNSSPAPRPQPQSTITPPATYLYYAQPGDFLKALLVRFNVDASEITSPDPIPQKGLINPGQLLVIPNKFTKTTPSTLLMPDSEIVYSPSTVDFAPEFFVSQAGGHLSTYKEYLASGWFTGGQMVQYIAKDNSINPRILLSLMEYQSRWVYGQPTNLAEWDYPLGDKEFAHKDLYQQLAWGTRTLFAGYYGWREGRLTVLTYPDGTKVRLAPDLNAGSVALLYFFSRMYPPDRVNQILYSSDGYLAVHEKMFGDYWQRAQTFEPIFPAGTVQPTLELPYLPGKAWSLTGGPHSAWGEESTWAALDLAPPLADHGCYPTHLFVTASAPGLVTRSDSGVVVIDLDGDGKEQTGWTLLYLHIAADGRIPIGTRVDVNQAIGHPSCEGGVSTGTHTHFARRYNGEWIRQKEVFPLILAVGKPIMERNHTLER